MKTITATMEYEHTFELEVEDDATDSEIEEAICEADEYLGGNWNITWK